MVLIEVFAAFFLLLHDTSAEPPADFPGDETPYRVSPSPTDTSQATGTASAGNIAGAYLYGYLDCNKVFGEGAKDKIDDAYYGAWLMVNAPGVASDIDWNLAPTMEFLGPPGFNIAHRPNIQAVFSNTAKVIHGYENPIQQYIKVRCDDPRKRCQKRPAEDECQPNPPNPGDPPKPTPLAYAMNSDPDTSGTPMINFCEGFFNRRSLADGIRYGLSLDGLDKYHLGNYDNRAQAFLHELFHLDLAADSPGPNLRVDDFQINFKMYWEDKSVTTMAYGPLATKILARYYGWGSGPGSVGYYVQRNADNLVYYALTMYVMTKMDAYSYPYLPRVVQEVDGLPHIPRPSGSLISFVTKDGQLYLNASTDDLMAYNSSPGDDYPGCRDDENEYEDEHPETIAIDTFAPDSAYPDEYNFQVLGWLGTLDFIDGGEDSSSEGHIGQQIAIPRLS